MLVNNVNNNLNINNRQYWLDFRQSASGQPYGNNDLSLKQKSLVLGASTAGMVSGLFLSGRNQNLNIFRWNELKKIKIGGLEILALAGGSIIGGLLAGFCVDSANKRDKLRESLQQMVGNIMFPVSFVAGANALYDKFSQNIKWPQYKNKFLTACVKTAPPVIVTFAALFAGIYAGNKFSNRMNNKLFRDEENRKIKITDFAAHVDDTLLGATLVAQNLSHTATTGGLSASSATTIIGETAAKLIPPALVIPGYMTGTAGNKKSINSARA